MQLASGSERGRGGKSVGGDGVRATPPFPDGLMAVEGRYKKGLDGRLRRNSSFFLSFSSCPEDHSHTIIRLPQANIQSVL